MIERKKITYRAKTIENKIYRRKIDGHGKESEGQNSENVFGDRARSVHAGTLSRKLELEKHCDRRHHWQRIERVCNSQVLEPEETAVHHRLQREVGHSAKTDKHRNKNRHLKETFKKIKISRIWGYKIVAI